MVRIRGWMEKVVGEGGDPNLQTPMSYAERTGLTDDRDDQGGDQ
jgi:hypothetical protein